MRLLLILMTFAVAGCANSEKAESHAREFASTNYPDHELVAVLCDTSDDDENGQVRCNVSLRRPDGEVHVPAIECPARWVPQFSTQCKILRGAP